ncbi:MAG: hypothetical protein AB7K24_26235 [Gemmataceae bacterium]
MKTERKAFLIAVGLLLALVLILGFQAVKVHEAQTRLRFEAKNLLLEIQSEAAAQRWDRAAELLARLDGMIRAEPGLEPELAERLDELRREVDQALSQQRSSAAGRT